MESKIIKSIFQTEDKDFAIFDDIVYSKGFYEFVDTENTNKLIPYSFLGYDNGNLVSFAPCFIQKKSVTFDPQGYLNGKIRKILNLLGLKTENFFVVYSPYRLKSDIKTIPGESKEHIFNKILEGVPKLQCDAIVFPFVSENNKEISNLKGAIYNKDGLDIYKLIDLRKRYGDDCLKHYLKYDTNHKLIPRDEILKKECGIFIPAARPNSTNKNNMKHIWARIIILAANISYDYKATKYLFKKEYCYFQTLYPVAAEFIGIRSY